MVKNARNRVVQNQGVSRDKYPSYFVECLMYNIPDDEFSTNRQNTFTSAIIWLGRQAGARRLSEFMCQNGFVKLFGTDADQWNESDAVDLIGGLLDMWEGW